MSGEDFQEEAVLAAVKPLKAAELSADYADYAEQSSTGSSLANFTARDSGDLSSASRVLLTEKVSNLESLFRQHSDRVFRTAHRVTGSAADAEDVLQTVFLRLARGTESPSVLDNPEGYFARAAINASLDLLRSRKRSRAVAFD